MGNAFKNNTKFTYSTKTSNYDCDTINFSKKNISIQNNDSDNDNDNDNYESILMKNNPSQFQINESIITLNNDVKPVKIESDHSTVKIETDIKTADATQHLLIEIDHDQFVKLFMDPRIELSIDSMAYLIGYKMVYVVDAYRRRIPNVVAIVTLKINCHNNIVYQSEGKHSKKDYYELLKRSNCISKYNHYDRDAQSESLQFVDGNMIAWEHSTKYCAHNVETLALTFCGKFRDVIMGCQSYDNNKAFAESAYTYEENVEPIIYEVGKVNCSKNDVPNTASGKCLDFFHFFLRPEYAMDYGFWQFQFSDKRSDVNLSELVLGKKFSLLRKVSHQECYNNNFRNRNDVTLVKTDKGYVSSQVLIEAEKMTAQNKINEKITDEIARELERELEKEANDYNKFKSASSSANNNSVTSNATNKIPTTPKTPTVQQTKSSLKSFGDLVHFQL